MMFYDWLQSRDWIYHFKSFEYFFSCFLPVFRVISLQYWSIKWFLMFWNRQSQHSSAMLWLQLEEMLLVQVVELVNVFTRVPLDVFLTFSFNRGAQSDVFTRRWCCGECIHKSWEEVRVRGDENCRRSKQCNDIRWNYFWGKWF